MQINVKQNFNENISFQYKNIEFLKACDIDTWKGESSYIFGFPLCEKDLSTMSLAEKTNLKLFMQLKICTVWLVITSSSRFLSA